MLNINIIIGWFLDLIFGDPSRLPHPIVWFGKWIAMGEKRLNKGRKRKTKGAVFVCLSIALLFGISWALLNLLPMPLYITIAINAILIFYCLAGHTLRKEVRMVFEAVDRSTEEGRKQVARIVGRDTSELSPQEIRTAALETLAENLSDGVIAPLFWYAIFGVPGMLTYKLINTFDSMVGYQNERYKDFGCWAAHIDDIANYIPARITALLMIIVAPVWNKWQLLRFVFHFGPQHASPNSGWPEAALAGILNCRFGGPHNYFGEYFYKPYIGTNERELTTNDMKKSIMVCLLAEIITVGICAILTLNTKLMTSRTIYLITGGQRSGKSTKAEELALSLSPTPVYLATAHIWDDEFRERVARHQARRGPNWTNIEEELYPSHHDVSGKVVLIDCCTLWATNFFFRDSKGEELPDVDKTLAELKDEFDRFTSQDATFIFVTNEIGLGGVSANAVQRRFTDLMGWFNQYIAQKADEVIMMVSGVEVKIKEPQPLTCPSGILSPRGEEEVTNDPSKESSQAIKGNFSLAPWGEGVRRTGEGLGGRGRLALALQSKIDNLNKPKGSLGRLESLALQIGLIQHTLSPKLTHPCHILFGGDHGIEREGVSFSPREVTWQQMINYGKGGGGVNMFCRQHGFKLLVVDAGVDYDFPAEKYPHIIHRKVGYGTRNFLHEAAMSEDEFDRCLAIGAEMVDKCHDEGCNIICFGEMGIGNTSPSSILMHLFLDIPLTECVGAGSGLPSEGVKHKYEVLKTSVDNYLATLPQNHDAAYTIRYFSGFEMACAVGGMLRAAELGMIILVDGFIMSACMLAASRLNKNVMDYAIFGHCGDEGGHKLMLDAMNAKPLLHLGMRLGEGTGALCAYPIVQSAVNMINEMDNFAHAEITKYF